ncbi:uncharacterized protein LOC126372075 [Pectinophora gossypiella]|uniref:uncharacterized protein LOC126372075 n=1 Tax=Pectinophora gossypiella TaxID=13191 RepID=UPI00214DF137|nr:uncharacterized protein LOC126372075 [Pectinophora gossypiella]
MQLSERLLVVLVLLCTVVYCEDKTEPKRKGRHLLALLGYLHGYKIGQEYALQYPSYLITPIVVVPSVNQQQSVNIQSGGTDEKYQENGGTIQTITHDKIMCKNNTNTSKNEDITDTSHMNDDIEVRIVTKPVDMKVETIKKDAENITTMLRQGLTSDENVTNTNTSTTTADLVLETLINTTENKNNIGTTTIRSYPSAEYDNQEINSLSLTTSLPIEGNQALPPIKDNRWQNFSLETNLSDIMSDDNVTMINEQQNNTLPSSLSTENVTEYPTLIETITYKGPYPNAWYYHPAIDQLSITTNYYTNEPPPPVNDRWGSFSPMNKITLPSGFRPLAGLYYDGFLHTPLKKYGFFSQNSWK